MWRPSTVALGRILALAAAILVLKVTLSVVAGYRAYFPPDFEAEFLAGREAYFFGAYQWAFYAHLVAGPVSLVLGMVLVSDWFRGKFPRWHRRLGKLLIGCVLLILVPSGLWMAPYAATGAVAGAGLGLLAVATSASAVMGWRRAVARRFDEHRRWMWRLYLLLCSAVVIRVMGGLATVLGIDAEWVYPASVWASWVGPLVILEVAESWAHAAQYLRHSRRLASGAPPRQHSEIRDFVGVVAGDGDQGAEYRRGHGGREELRVAIDEDGK